MPFILSPSLTLLLNVLRIGPLCLCDGQDGELGYKGSLGGRLGISQTFVLSSLHTSATQT